MPHEPDGVLDFGVTPSEYVADSGDQNIDAQIYNLRWADRDLTFSFPNSKSDFGPDYPDFFNATPDIIESFSKFANKEQKAAYYWVEHFASVSQLTFKEFDGKDGTQKGRAEATIKFSHTEETGGAYAAFPGFFDGTEDEENDGDVWLNPSLTGAKKGNYVHYTIGHELGHAVGLAHGHDADGGSGILEAQFNSSEFSIMTYAGYIGGPPFFTTGPGSAAQTLMMFDMAALQYLYGANFNHRARSTDYSWNTKTGEMFINGKGQGEPAANKIFMTVWDGNGSNDHYNLSNYKTNLMIDLRPGMYSDFDVGGNRQRADLGVNENGVEAFEQTSRGHVFNALLFEGDERSLIEHATGGSGNDHMVGNQTNNVLKGRQGKDMLEGMEQKDMLMGGKGRDMLDGGTGRDKIVGGKNWDHLLGGDHRDVFAFKAAGHIGKKDGKRDIIGDFEQGLDVINLKSINAKKSFGIKVAEFLGIDKDHSFKFIGTDTFNGKRGELRYKTDGFDTFVEGDRNGNGRADFRLELTGVFALDESDFIL